MAEKGRQLTQPENRARAAAREQDPAAIARRELVEWCRQHQLPVPEERSAQPSAR
jgi:hypothetical protein